MDRRIWSIFGSIKRLRKKDCSGPCPSIYPWITPKSTSHTTPSKSHCCMSNYALDTHMHRRSTCPKLSSSSTNQFILLLCSCSFNLIQFLKTGFIFISSPPPALMPHLSEQKGYLIWSAPDLSSISALPRSGAIRKINLSRFESWFPHL